MITPLKHDYAFGLGVTPQDGHRLISHGGGIEGFRTNLGYYTDDRVTVVVLGNVSDGAPVKIGTALGALVDGETVQSPAERKAISLPRATLQQYVGTYEPKFPLFPETEPRVSLKVVDAQVVFEKNDQGKVTGFVLHQSGRDVRAQRISGTVKAPVERKAIAIAPEALRQYTGTYPLSPAFAITVTLEDGQLMEQATRRQKFPIFPGAKDKFFLKVVDAQIEFVRDVGGTVKSLILHQGGRDPLAPKQ